MYQDKSHESGTPGPNTSPCQRTSSSGKARSEVFIVGDWDRFNDWFGSDDDDDDAFTGDVNSSGSREWADLEHEDADPTSYQPGSLSPQSTTPPPSETSSSDSESDSDSELSEAQREQQISCAQLVLVNRAIYPQRRESLLPYRKNIILNPMPLKIQAKKSQDQAGASQCPQCSSTIFRMVSKNCVQCAMNTSRGTIEDLEFQGQLNEDEYYEANVRISDRKCAIEDEHPDDYMDDTEWLDLRAEHIGLSEERAENKADREDRVAELEAQIRQYGEWVEEDLAKFR